MGNEKTGLLVHFLFRPNAVRNVYDINTWANTGDSGVLDQRTMRLLVTLEFVFAQILYLSGATGPHGYRKVELILMVLDPATLGKGTDLLTKQLADLIAQDPDLSNVHNAFQV